MQYTTIQLPSFEVAGITLRTNNMSAMQQATIPAFWEKFLKEDIYKTIPNNAEPNAIYGLYTDYASDHRGDYTLLLGAKVNNAERLTNGLVRREIPTANYAVFSTDSPQKVFELWQIIWTLPLQRTYRCDFEVYRQDASVIDINISIK
jgi:predicted transcriptional regulator YdeE